MPGPNFDVFLLPQKWELQYFLSINLAAPPCSQVFLDNTGDVALALRKSFLYLITLQDSTSIFFVWAVSWCGFTVAFLGPSTATVIVPDTWKSYPAPMRVCKVNLETTKANGDTPVKCVLVLRVGDFYHGDRMQSALLTNLGRLFLCFSSIGADDPEGAELDPCVFGSKYIISHRPKKKIGNPRQTEAAETPWKIVNKRVYLPPSPVTVWLGICYAFELFRRS